MALRFLREPLPDDYFGDGQKLTKRGKGRVEKDRDSLVDLINVLRQTSITRGYIVDPNRSDMFETVEEAVAQGEQDNTNGSIIILLANGVTHSLPAAGLDLDTGNEYIFRAMPDVGGTGGPTVLSGDIDCKATVKINSRRRPVVFHNIVTDINLTVRENRSVTFQGGFFRSSTITFEHGDDGVEITFLQSCADSGQRMFELDSPSPLRSLFFCINSDFVLSDFFGDALQLGGFTSVQFTRTRFVHYSFATDRWFDFRNLAPKVKFRDCLFSLTPAANHLLFKNAANVSMFWEGRNSFDREQGIGTGTFTVDFGGPTHKGAQAPVVATGASPINRPLGTRKFDDSDDGGSWTYLSWNGATWV